MLFGSEGVPGLDSGVTRNIAWALDNGKYILVPSPLWQRQPVPETVGNIDIPKGRVISSVRAC